ncbi:hypothetical protein GE21DRAFT_8140, partial [Neurospora crassa]
MAVMGSSTTRYPVAYGRSGYNKDGDDEEKDKKNLINFGRSGYNKDGDDDEENKFRNFGRSGYNKGDDGDDEEQK